MNIPQYNQQYQTDRTAQGYVSQNVPHEAFLNKSNISKQVAYASRAMSDYFDDIKKQQEEDETNKIVELGNQYDMFRNTALYDKDTGYYNTTGKNAIDGYENIQTQLNDKKNSIIEECNLSEKGKAKLENTLQTKIINDFKGLNNHVKKNDIVYKQTVLNDTLDINNQKAVQDRYNPDLINSRLADINNAVSVYSSALGYDDVTKSALIKSNTENLHVSVLNQYIADGDKNALDTASNYLEKHKNDISAENYTKISNSLNISKEKLARERDKEEERRIADDIFSKAQSEEEALNIASQIDKVETSDAVIGRLKIKYSDKKRFENQQQADMLNNFYVEANRRIESGEPLSYDMINPNLAAETQLGLKNFVDKSGNPETDNLTWENLYDMRVNNAQGFASMDLYKYRGFLSESDFRYFLKEQEDIKNGNFYSNIKDDDKMINAALTSLKLNGNTSWFGKTAKNKDIAYSEIRTFVREFEARKGRSITDTELQNFISDLGYKGSDGVPIYKELERGMREKVNFIKDVTNDFVYYSKKHNGQMPSNEEKEKIIKYRLAKKVEEKKTKAEQIISNYTNNAQTFRDISNTVPKPNEQKILTSFADNDVPRLSKELGLDLRVTSRYRNDPKSKHGQGRALDIGLARFNNQQILQVYDKLIKEPKVYKLGCSDPNVLAKYGHDKSKTNYNPKIVDETDYDRKHGTNHVNHVHVTLYNDKDYMNIAQNDNGIYRI